MTAFYFFCSPSCSQPPSPFGGPRLHLRLPPHQTPERRPAGERTAGRQASKSGGRVGAGPTRQLGLACEQQSAQLVRFTTDHESLTPPFLLLLLICSVSPLSPLWCQTGTILFISVRVLHFKRSNTPTIPELGWKIGPKMTCKVRVRRGGGRSPQAMPES